MRGRRSRWYLLALAGLVVAGLGVQGAAAGGRTVTVQTDVALERVAGDVVPPFDQPEAGDSVFVRVSATSDGPAVVRRQELRVVANVSSSERPSVRGRRGLRCEIRATTETDLWKVLCLNSIVVREGDEVSVLLRVEAAGQLMTVEAGAAARPGSGLTVRSRKDETTILVAEARGPWAGTWTWKATWPGGSFTGEAMLLGQQGATVCSTWAWSQGGRAKGTVAGATWSASWRDGFGAGTWTLTLGPDGSRFTGTQSVDPHAPSAEGFTAQITGERTGETSRLDCGAISLDRPGGGGKR